MSAALTLEEQPGLDEGILGALRSARAVALARWHMSPVTLVVHDGDQQTALTLVFDTPTERMQSAWADRGRTTEWAAEAIALEVVHAQRGMGTLRRAARGTRFDWYIARPGGDFEDAVALEIGGTDEQNIDGVLAKKLRQIRRRASGRPGIAIAVQFVTPHAMLRDG